MTWNGSVFRSRLVLKGMAKLDFSSGKGYSAYMVVTLLAVVVWFLMDAREARREREVEEHFKKTGGW